MTDAPRDRSGNLHDSAALLADGWEELSGGDGFFGLLGPHWQKQDGAHYLLGFLVAAKHLNRNGVVHGGVLASLADNAMGLAARQHELGRFHATIQLGIHYTAAARLGEFVFARCTVKRSTRQLDFVEADIFSGERLAATAQGIWKMLKTAPTTETAK
ncbi:MAG TPA: PaaI family thioesterase [Devosia sp.]|nr:PaaI family thioesterase [Devosia sp.]